MANQLFSEFEPQTEQSWESKILADLKGRSKDELTSITEDGIKIQPNYFDLKESSSVKFRQTSEWKMTFSSNNSSNQELMIALEGGINDMLLKVNDETNLESLFKNIMLDIIDCQLIYQGSNLPSFIDKNQAQLANCKIFIDPFENEATHDCYFLNAATYRNAGATASQQMSFALSQAVELIEKDPKYITIQLGIGPDYFNEIAMLRGFRSCLNQVIEEFQWKGDFSIISVPSSYYLSSKDVNNNILRISTMSMSAILGGSDELNIPAFNLKPSEFSNRISKNVQIILEQESYFGNITDPSSGSYFIEKLTNELEEKAWGKFQSIESAGGFSKNLKDGSIYRMIDLAHMGRLQKYAANKKIMLGVNKYKLADSDEMFVESESWNNIQSRNLSQLIRKGPAS
jgi:methylmalonyl-CoA mutase